MRLNRRDVTRQMFLLDWDMDDRVSGLNPTPSCPSRDTDWPPVLGDSQLWWCVKYMNKNQVAGEKTLCMLHKAAPWMH